jgi:acetyl esterase/lipase
VSKLIVVRNAVVLGLLVIVAGVLALAAAALAGLTVAPAPSYDLARVAVAVAEKSFVPALGGLVAALLASKALDSQLRWIAGAIALLGLIALAISLVPPLQALLIARDHGFHLDPVRYLTAPIELEVGRAPFTINHATVAGQKLNLDVYPAPADASRAGAAEPARRAIVLVHGGGWSAGVKSETARANAQLAAQGFHVFDIDYRLAPAARWKEMTGDVKCAVGWIKRHTQLRLGDRTIAIDPARVALFGRSAGGQLALLAGFSKGDAAVPPSCAVDDSGVDAVIAFYAPTDLVWGYANPTRPQVYDSGAKLRGLMGGPPEAVGNAYERASPSVRAHAKAPPVLLVHGERDQLVSPLHVDWLIGRLQALGVYNEQLKIPYAQHGFDYVVGGLSSQLGVAAGGGGGGVTNGGGRAPPATRGRGRTRARARLRLRPCPRPPPRLRTPRRLGPRRWLRPGPWRCQHSRRCLRPRPHASLRLRPRTKCPPRRS